MALAKSARTTGVITEPPATDITVSGFGPVFGISPNAVYSPDGTFNGSPQWSYPIALGGSYTIRWSGERWEFGGRITSANNTTFLVGAFSYRGTEAGPPCDGWYPITESTRNQITLASACSPGSPLTGTETVTITGFVGGKKDYNGTYSLIGTQKGGNVWMKTIAISGTTFSFLFIRWTGNRWEIVGDAAPFLANSGQSGLPDFNALNGIGAYNTACPQSNTVLPCVGWEATDGYPLITSGCSEANGVPLFTSIPTSVSSLTLAPTFAIPTGYTFSTIPLSLNGNSNGAPKWTGPYTIPNFSGTASLEWSNNAWAVIETTYGAPILTNTGGSINEIPVSGWNLTIGGGSSFTYALVTERLVYSGQPACQASFTACLGSSFRLPLSVVNAVSYQWFKGATTLSGQTSATLNLANPQLSDAGEYSLSATGVYGSLVSNKFLLTVGNPPDFTIPSLTITCQRQTGTLSASGCSGQVVWSTGTTGNNLIVTAGSSTSTLTATCTAGSCKATASGVVSVAKQIPAPGQILSLLADERNCPVQLPGQAIGTTFIFTGPDGYVFSSVFRTGGRRNPTGVNVKKPGVYTLTTTVVNDCGSSTPVSQSVTVSRVCP